MRRALRDVLPPRILRRNSKGSVDEALCRAVQREWNEFDHLSRWQVCERELVDPQRLRREVELMKLGLQAPTNRMVRVFSGALAKELEPRAPRSAGGRELTEDCRGVRAAG